MKELKVGMYVRTKDGEIHRIKSITNEYIEYENGFGVPYELREYIVKANENPIYVLEKNDYVNGCRVIKVNIPEIVGHYSYVKCINDNVFKENEIKSIVTKEQFESMEYKVC